MKRSYHLQLNRLRESPCSDDFGPTAIGFFDPDMPVAHLVGDLPHWRQDGVTYFVTFRLADSLPQEKLRQWQDEKAVWLQSHPEPHDQAARREFYDRFPSRLQRWLDAGDGSSILAIESVRGVVENVLRHFDRSRYSLDEFVVAANHVHVLVTPLARCTLSGILHSWKSFSAHEILKIEPAVRRLSACEGESLRASCRKVAAASRRRVSETNGAGGTASSLTVWQKESFDHIVRSAASLHKFREYIRAHVAAR